MQNTVLASIEFYFKGIRYAFSAVIDMDTCMRHGEPMRHIYQTLASENGISLHGYEFDVMEMENIEFSEPSGLVVDFFDHGVIDIDGLHDAWQREKIHSTLQAIASKHLGVDNLDENPALKAALLEAFQAN